MNVAFIPVRGGSKSIPLKNIKIINKKPLVYWAIKAACECNFINEVCIFTDDDRIRKVVNEIRGYSELEASDKIKIVDRSEKSATDIASTEFAMLEFASNYEFENIVLIQATSPLIKSNDLNKGFEKFGYYNIDTVLSVVRQKRFMWDINEHGVAEPVNYDIFNRPRRQEFEGYLVENGAFYITSKDLLLKSSNRISGNIGVVEMDESSYLEMDEPSDWIAIENILANDNGERSVNKNIKMFLTDCDGCLTDGGMYYSENGDELKKFNARDGMAFSILRKKDIITGMVTGESRELNKRRAEKLKLNIYEYGCRDKLAKVQEIIERYQISMDNVVYIGDDINDEELMRHVGYACSPNDGIDKVKQQADYITSVKGGEGVIREVVEHLIDRDMI